VKPVSSTIELARCVRISNQKPANALSRQALNFQKSESQAQSLKGSQNLKGTQRNTKKVFYSNITRSVIVPKELLWSSLHLPLPAYGAESGINA